MSMGNRTACCSLQILAPPVLACCCATAYKLLQLARPSMESLESHTPHGSLQSIKQLIDSAITAAMPNRSPSGILEAALAASRLCGQSSFKHKGDGSVCNKAFP
jgi:hypothetical protein